MAPGLITNFDQHLHQWLREGDNAANYLKAIIAGKYKGKPAAIEIGVADVIAAFRGQWTPREQKMREAISKAWQAQTMTEVHDALQPIISDPDCCRPSQAQATPGTPEAVGEGK